MRRSMMLVGIATLLTWSTAAAAAATAASTAPRKITAYVPRNAQACEWAATRQNAPKFCKQCNTNTKVGAAEKVTVQVGGCGANQGQLSPICDFTATGMECFETIIAPRLEVGEFEAGGISTGDMSVDELTVGDLIVTGTSTHAGLETFNGDIETDFIYSTDPASVSVQIPGSGPDSTQIGPNGKEADVCMLGLVWKWVCLSSCIVRATGRRERLTGLLRHALYICLIPPFTSIHSRGVGRHLSDCDR
jgi:hypothetical protein